MHTHDEAALQRMLGLADVPPKVAQECDLRLNMYHRDGNSGPLGSLALIAMVRYLGYAPLPAKSGSTSVDWHGLPRDGSLRVEAEVFEGDWQPGRFRGFVGAGSLQVELDGDPVVREFYPSLVRLPVVVDELLPEWTDATAKPPDLTDTVAVQAEDAAATNTKNTKNTKKAKKAPNATNGAYHATDGAAAEKK